MHTATLPAPTLAGDGRLGACVGAAALVSMLAFEAMAVAAAMPAIAGALDGLSLYALAFGGTLATSVLGMVLAGRWCDRDGPLRATAAGLAVFAAGLAIAALADRMAGVVVGRVVQGLGSGMLGVALYVGMGQLVPPALHPRLFAMMAAAWVLPGLAGPLLAAWMTQHLGWRSVFGVVFVASLLVAAPLLGAFARLPRPDGTAASRPATAIAWAAVAAAGALALHGAAQGRTLAALAAALGGGLVAATLAARRLLPAGSLSARPGLPSVIVLRALLAAAFATAEAFLPLYLTHEAGWSLAEAGLALSAGAVMWSGGSAVQARIERPAWRRRALQGGFALVSLGLAAIVLPVAAGAATWAVGVGWSVTGFGIGLAFPMLSVLTLGLSAPGEQGRNASALQLGDALGCSAALAVAGVLFNAIGGAAGHLAVLLLTLALALAGVALSPRAVATRAG